MRIGHLILTRKIGQAVVITMADGTEVVVWIAGVERDRVKVWVDAPVCVQVAREELTR